MISQHTFWQLTKFGLVGCTAAIVNFIVVVAVVEHLNLSPLWANVIAFACAYQVSFAGHHFWTFASTQRVGQFPWLKFLLVALLSFALNEGLFYIFLTYVGWYYTWSLITVLLIVPPLTFLCSKYWAFA